MQHVANILATAQHMHAQQQHTNEDTLNDALRTLAQQMVDEHSDIVLNDNDEEYNEVAELIVQTLLGDEMYNDDDEEYSIDAKSDFDYYTAYFTNTLVC